MGVKKNVNRRNLAVKNTVKPSINVKTKVPKTNNGKLLFSFVNFKIHSINIEGEFNNFFKNEQDFINTMTIMLGMGLPLFSNEDINSLDKDIIKQKQIHYHRIKENKYAILEKILNAYGFSDDFIDNIIDGGNIYQFQIMGSKKSCRAVVHRVENIIYFLFLDVNHHIYFNKKLVEEANSLFYEFCPINIEGFCERMNYLNTCFVFDYLDIDKYRETFDFTYSPFKK